MKPILLDIPEEFETERLLIRVPRPGYGAIVNAAIQESLEELRPWMPWVQTVPTVEDTEEYCRGAYARFLARTDLPLQLYLKDGCTFVGSSGLHDINWDVPKFETGYWCRTRFQGQGYITEAVHGVSRFCFETLGAKRVQIRCDARNVRSRRVAERSGYKLEGEFRHDGLSVDGKELRNTLMFSMLRDEYFAQAK